MASAQALPTTVIPVSKQRQEFVLLRAEWMKKSAELIAAPLFKGGVIDREAHEKLRKEEAEARKRLADFLDSPGPPDATAHQ